MNYYIGIDSGGTKTETILADEQGHIVYRTLHCGCNPMDVGVEAAQHTIRSIVKEVQAVAPCDGPIVSLYAGIAGANHAQIMEESGFAEESGIRHVRIEDDRRIVLSGTLGHVNGCGMICGTGSSLSIIREGEPIRQVGGLGYLIDTGGSGYELGQAALKHLFRYLDGRGEYTVLAELIPRHMGKQPWEGMADIYAGGRPYIASLAHTVFEGLEMGDDVCRRIVEAGAYALAELTHAAARQFEGVFPVVMTGGILRSYPGYAEMVCKQASPKAKMIMSSAPPVYGALVEAMWQCGKQAGEEISRNFAEDYARITKE